MIEQCIEIPWINRIKKTYHLSRSKMSSLLSASLFAVCKKPSIVWCESKLLSLICFVHIYQKKAIPASGIWGMESNCDSNTKRSDHIYFLWGWENWLTNDYVLNVCLCHWNFHTCKGFSHFKRPNLNTIIRHCALSITSHIFCNKFIQYFHVAMLPFIVFVRRTAGGECHF